MIAPVYDANGITLYHGSCLDVLPAVPDASVDCCITDPPYPCIKRDYGVWTEAEWFDMMRRLVPEVMRTLKPTGSAVFILQPNSERVGRMRTWLWEFMSWVGKEWGIVQDAWWWNTCAAPTVHTHRDRGLMRPSVKPCVWVGGCDCYRDQGSVLLPVSDRATQSVGMSNVLKTKPSGQTWRDGRTWATTVERGGSTPFNLLPMGNGSSIDHEGRSGHGAATPLNLADWWTRYICPEGGMVLDPFMGSGTMGLAAIKRGRSFIGIERHEPYFEIARSRMIDELDKTPLFAGDKSPLFSEATTTHAPAQASLFAEETCP